MNEACLAQLDLTNTTIELSQWQALEAEADEMWRFVQAKQHQRWLWHTYAFGGAKLYDHDTREILADVLANHKDAAFLKLQALKLGWGGVSYISQLLGCDDEAMQLGQRELNDVSRLQDRRIRQPGGGRKLALATVVGLDDAFLQVIAAHTAGSPMTETIKWTNLTRQEIAQLLQGEGMPVSVTVIDQLREQHRYRKRKAQKRLSTGTHPQRNAQFEKINQLKATDEAAGKPVVSMDTKKEN